MNFLVSVIIILICDAVLTFYLVNSEYFLPFDFIGDVDVWNIMVFVILVSSILGLLVTVCIYVGEKLLYCGRSEWPPSSRAVRIGVVMSVLLAGSLLLHVFHFLNFFIGAILIILLIVGIIIIK
ncbi:MAG: hypothetical protein U9Q67_00685 [Patescibacteria group bacterium]|nr:hypothetical protein [Patescibacteria group bacterium]